MSIESFLRQNGPDDEFRYFVGRKVEIERNRGHLISPLTALARMYRDTSREELEILTTYLSTFIMDDRPHQAEELLGYLSDSQTISMWRNHTAIIFAATICTLEATIESGISNLYIFDAEYNFGVTGTMFKQASETSDNMMYTLTDEEWAKEINLSHEDPTLGIFFEPKGYNAIPANLRQMLGFEDAFLDTRLQLSRVEIIRSFLPDHRALAAVVL